MLVSCSVIQKIQMGDKPACYVHFIKSSLPFQVDASFTEQSDGQKVSAQAEFYRVFVQFI